jgi:hypothetical protein
MKHLGKILEGSKQRHNSLQVVGADHLPHHFQFWKIRCVVE